jgi:hypothetical protein
MNDGFRLETRAVEVTTWFTAWDSEAEVLA